MKVTLINYPHMPGDEIAGLAAAICTDSDNHERALNHAMDSGHNSVAEHAAYTFLVEGVSRVLLAQLTRNRIASFSVQSQRYCGVKPEWVVPQTIIDKDLAGEYVKMCQSCYETYLDMIGQGVPEEDARYVIPQGVTCKLLVTMNARELLHFFELRCCNRAQWEIREMAWAMLAEVRKIAPRLFRDAGPGCLRGACPEKRPCGKPYRREETNADERTAPRAAEKAGEQAGD